MVDIRKKPVFKFHGKTMEEADEVERRWKEIAKKWEDMGIEAEKGADLKIAEAQEKARRTELEARDLYDQETKVSAEEFDRVMKGAQETKEAIVRKAEKEFNNTVDPVIKAYKDTVVPAKQRLNGSLEAKETELTHSLSEILKEFKAKKADLKAQGRQELKEYMESIKQEK